MVGGEGGGQQPIERLASFALMLRRWNKFVAGGWVIFQPLAAVAAAEPSMHDQSIHLQPNFYYAVPVNPSLRCILCHFAET